MVMMVRKNNLEQVSHGSGGFLAGISSWNRTKPGDTSFRTRFVRQTHFEKQQKLLPPPPKTYRTT